MTFLNLPEETDLVLEIRHLIDESRSIVATHINSELTLLYWKIGHRIHTSVLKGKRAEYGKEVIGSLARQLELDYGRSFSEKNLRHMVAFASAFPDESIVSSVRRQLSWTHLKQVIYLDDPLKRDFYTEMCRLERWSTRTLEQKISSMLFERTALSKKPESVIRHELDTLRTSDQMTPDIVFKDPYLLDFLGLKDRYIERDLEDAILREIEAFILELGSGFSFIARQKRIQVDQDDYYLDLLFFHRGLRRLVAIELKLGGFKPAYKGQMELYLRWLQKYDMKPGEEAPIGLILCAGKKHETVELLELEKSSIRVAEYLTELPPRDVLEAKLHKAINQAKKRIGNED
jgi:predicted nuclease of restriction endonuclease-like (RecB) superfamily